MTDVSPDNHRSRPSRRVALTGVLAGLVLGAGVAFAVSSGDAGSAGSTTRLVTVTLAAPASSPSNIASPTLVPPVGTSFASIYRAAAPGVVDVTATSSVSADQAVPGAAPGSPSQSQVAEGTGFVIDTAGHILTNEHVIDGASAVTVTFADGQQAKADVVGSDPSRDLAALQVHVPASDLHPLPLGSSASVAPGQTVVAIGNPFGYVRSISAGIVSGINREISSPSGFTITGAIQTDAAINHGNSGGPLLDAAGRVIGVTAQIANSGVDANVGVGFAVPIDDATRELAALESGTVRHAWLGIAGQSLTPPVAAAARLHRGQGVLITGVTPGSPAAQAGLQGGSTAASVGGVALCVGGDAIVSVNGQAIRDMTDLQNVIGNRQPGATIDVGIEHSGQSGTQTVHITLARQPSTAPQSANGCGG